MTDDDRRLHDRLRAYESRVPDAPEPSTSLGGRPRWGVFAAVAAAAVLAGAVIANSIANQNVGQTDPTPSPSASSSQAPVETPSPAPSGSPEPTTGPTSAPVTPVPTPAPQSALSSVDWDDAASIVPGQAFRVGAEGGRFYVLGSLDRDAAIWSSADGTGWQVAVLPFPTAWDRDEFSFVYADEIATIDGRLVAIGEIGINDYLEAIVWESIDGTTWHEVDTGDFRQAAYNVVDVSAGPGGLVALSHQYVAGSGSAWRSADGGRTWTEHRPPGEGVTAVAVVGTGRGYLIAGAVNETYDSEVMSSPRIWYSPDGMGSSWVAASLDGSGRGVVDQLAIDGSGRWVAIGTLDEKVVVWRSLDRGLSWTTVSVLGEADGSGRSGFRLAGAPDGFIAVSGTDPAVTWTSSDGALWTQADPERPSGVSSDLQIGWQRGIGRVGDLVVMVGEAFGPEGRPADEWLSWAGRIVR